MTEQLLLSLTGAVFVGGAAAYLGSLMITRKMALVGDAFGHVALPGMGLALYLNVDPSLGAFAFLAVGVLLIWRLGERTSLSVETVVGITFVSSLALGYLIVPDPEILESLFGDISKLTRRTALASVSLSLVAFFLVRSLYNALMLMNLSSELAAVERIHTKKTNLLYLVSIALVVSLGVKFTGSLLVGALVIIPPATARIVTSDLRHYALASVVFGVASSGVGIIVSAFFSFPAGPAVILTSALFFLLAFAFYWRKPL